MRILTEKINLDLNQNGIQATIDLREGDIESRLIIATLRGYGDAFRPDDNVIAVIRAKKPDGTIIYNNCLVEDGKVKFLVTSQYAAVVGNYNACIELIKDGVVLYSPKFSFHVAANELSDSEVESSSEYTELTTALEQALTALELAQNLHLLKFVENLEDEGDEKYLYVLTSDYHYIPYVWDAENERYMELESNLEELAEFSYLLSIQKERVDNLLAEAVPGSTTRDLEVIDGRTGYDGRTYANLGTAIREQVYDLHSEATNLQNSMEAADTNLNNIKANKSDVNTITANIEAEIAVERARIDNIASLTEGSTTGDAELADIRVGADGNTYIDAGTAVRNQIKRTNDVINLLQDKQLESGKQNIISGFDVQNNINTNIPAMPFIINKSDYNFNNKLLTAIKLNVVTVGTLSIGYAEGNITAGTAYDQNNITIINTITISDTGIQTITLPNPFILPNDTSLVIGMPNNTIVFKYGDYGRSKIFYYVSSGSYYRSYRSLGIDIIGMPLENYKPIIENTKLFLPMLIDNIKTLTLLDSFDSRNNRSSSVGFSPFIINKNNTDGYLKSIKLNVESGGSLTISTIKKNKVIIGESFDLNDFKILDTILIEETGEQVYNFDENIKINSDEYLCLGYPTNSLIFSYGSHGNDKDFIFIDDNKYVKSVSSLGITANIYYINDNKSIYEGKSLSILGDSISTFDGYIPSGNLTYYPSGDVQSVTDTWWKKLITALGMELNINNSWSGSRVTTTAGETSAGCMTRCQNLGNSPDVIIVYMGINDFNNEVALGTYDGSTALPVVNTTFREAYAIMLNKILSTYQTSEVWVCTLPQCERNAETGFPEINGNGVALAEYNKAIVELANAFGVKVLDHNKSGLTYQNMPTYNPDNLHPNKLGHSVIANNDIRQLDNSVRLRY